MCSSAFVLENSPLPAGWCIAASLFNDEIRNDMGSYDVVVVGGGHAACEAALAAARCGAKVAMVTLLKAAIGRMSCNPSIGGIAKSHLVFELDALGGEMAKNADYTGIQFKTLNTSKGPAVQANRSQNDKDSYSRRLISVICSTWNIDVIEDTAADILAHHGHVTGVRLVSGRDLTCTAVVLAAGTFLNGRIHIGDRSWEGGRIDEPAYAGMSDALVGIGHARGRLKTGTPPRLLADSLDYSAMTTQPGDSPPPFFSWEVRRNHRLFHVEQSSDLILWQPGIDQLPCYLTHTTPETHRLIRENLTRSSLYGGQISGTGVRYCPSVEDKIVKFPDKDSHHVFIEPEGRANPLVYPNGISNSLPEDVQLELIHSIPGLANAKVAKWAYAIEYDFFDPTQLSHSLESKLLENLFLAGQINGTTGYEEAAAQGLMAGLNAARKVQQKNAVVIGRSDGYIGVLIDDLVTRGTKEPFRMFTSLAEHRLILRQDNARFRMLSAAREIGIADKTYMDETDRFTSEIATEIRRLETTRAGENSLLQILRQPGVHFDDLPGVGVSLDPEVKRQVEITVKYQGYIDREYRQVEKAKEMESVRIPSWMDYAKVQNLRIEAREKFTRIRPDNLGQAARIPGISPADVSVLAILIKQGPSSSRL
jgi:tRNA uridine 5-carboxymethylaminomethyl modification enzyme